MRVQFAVIDVDGWVLRFGACNEADLEAQGERVVRIERKPVNDGSRWRWVDGGLVKG